MSLIYFFYDTATTGIYTYGHTLSLHDALPISAAHGHRGRAAVGILAKQMDNRCLGQPLDKEPATRTTADQFISPSGRSEEHTSDPVTNAQLVCRLLLEKNTPPLAKH